MKIKSLLTKELKTPERRDRRVQTTKQPKKVRLPRVGCTKRLRRVGLKERCNPLRGFEVLKGKAVDTDKERLKKKNKIWGGLDSNQRKDTT